MLNANKNGKFEDWGGGREEQVMVRDFHLQIEVQLIYQFIQLKIAYYITHNISCSSID